MRQIVQSARDGKLELVEVPAPSLAAGQIRVRTTHSVVSPGTEGLMLSFARKSLLGKARSRPDLVKQVARKLRQEGPLPTLRTVRNRLDAPQPLGYSSAGVVLEAAPDVEGFAPGDRVACAGAGYANHAEVIVVPANLAVTLPDAADAADAAFATLGAIALQGLRVAAPSFGEIAVVIGLGLIGQLTVQLLRANGCRVLAIDLDPQRVKEARALGAEWGGTPGDDFEAWRSHAAGGYGADFAILAASAKDAAPLALGAELCRPRGRLSLVGAFPIEAERRVLYEKELELRMSTSYGPGRYDRRYEELGLDYPITHVRWTENRNLQAFVAAIAAGSVRPTALDVARVPFADALRVYEELGRGERRSLATLFEYEESPSLARSLAVGARRSEPKPGGVGIGFVGAGNYAKAVLLPALGAESGLRREIVATSTGPSARRTAERFGFARCATDPAEAIQDPSVDLVFIATQHDSHAELAARALEAGKSVWLEKPLAIDAAGVARVAAAAREAPGLLAVGFNRRFSSHARVVRELFEPRRGPLAIDYTVAAGPAPIGTWITDPTTGGGRIVGEACHFVDLCSYLVGAPVSTVYARALAPGASADDSMLLVLGYPDGSTAAIHYLANASGELPKERFEVSGDGRTARCDNFRTTEVLGGKRHRTVNQDKGQTAALAAVLHAVRNGAPSPFGLEELVATSLATLAAERSAREGVTLEVRLEAAEPGA